ncbi:hypothetical protein AHF37_03403 [Paragonimus kellicotti]|nr:hypothetical protein AHF37_03403 [Paragonimus kellicotti]
MTNEHISDPIPKDIPNDPKILDYNVDLEKDDNASDSAKNATRIMKKLLESRVRLLAPMLLEGDTSQVVRSQSSVLTTKRISGEDDSNLTMSTNKRGSHITLPDLCTTNKKPNGGCNRSLIVQSVVSDTNLLAFVSEVSPPKIPTDSYSGTASVSVYDELEEFLMEASEDSFFVILLKRQSAT